jgi:hypothetical protein
MPERSGNKKTREKRYTLILVPGIVLLIGFLIIPATQTTPDLVNDFANLSKIAPASAAPSGNVTGEMAHYTGWLNGMASAMMSFLNQIMSLFGMGNQTFAVNSSGDLSKTLQQLLNPGNGSGTSP